MAGVEWARCSNELDRSSESDLAHQIPYQTMFSLLRALGILGSLINFVLARYWVFANSRVRGGSRENVDPAHCALVSPRKRNPHLC